MTWEGVMRGSVRQFRFGARLEWHPELLALPSQLYCLGQFPGIEPWPPNFSDWRDLQGHPLISLSHAPFLCPVNMLDSTEETLIEPGWVPDFPWNLPSPEGGVQPRSVSAAPWEES